MEFPRPDVDVIANLVGWAGRHADIQAVLLTSTRAIPGSQVDALSDYDIILVVDDLQPFVSDRRWLNDFGTVLVAYWDPVHPDSTYGIDLCANVVQYRDGLKIDFNLWQLALLKKIIASHTLPAELDAGYRVLVDKAHLTAGVLPPTGRAYILHKPSLEQFQLLVTDFLSDAPYVAKCLWRGELLPARWCLDYDMKFIYLLPALEWLAETEHGWLVPVGNLGKGLKKLLPGDIWEALEKTWVGSSITDSWEALFHLLELFRIVARQVGQYLGYAYPEQLHENVIEYIIQVRQLPRPIGLGAK